MQIKIAINGFGRIGRSFFREAFAAPFKALAKEGMLEFDIVAINDLADTKTLAYLLKYDSVYGRYTREVSAAEGALVVDGHSIPVFCEIDPSKLPWHSLGIDIVIESTGVFVSGEKANAHIEAGARRVVITSPAKGEGVTTALIGVNDDRFSAPHPITCNASCTTNSVAPVLKIFQDGFGIRKASMATIHAYTGAQAVVDTVDQKDMRRGRAAAINIVPSTTGAAEAVIQAIPELKGKFDAVAVRVPVVVGSLSVITIVAEQAAGRDEINELYRAASREPRWKNILKVTEDPIVSTDVIGEPYGAIVDLTLTKIADSDLVMLFSWYDNEAGYTATLIEHVRRVARLLETV